jgi:hypothetical protein
MVQEPRTCRVAYCVPTQVPYTVERCVPRCVCKTVPVTCTRLVSKCVPRQVAYEVCRMVPVTVCAQPDCPSCAVGGCTTCGATAPAGPLKPQAEVPQPQDLRKPPMQVIPPVSPPAAHEPGANEGSPASQPSTAGPKA